SPVEDDSYTYVSGETVGQDLALVNWANGSDDFGASVNKMSLLNTLTGEELWQVDNERETYFAAGSSTLDRALYATSFENGGSDTSAQLTLYDLSDGSVVAKADDLTFHEAPELLRGDFIAS